MRVLLTSSLCIHVQWATRNNKQCPGNGVVSAGAAKKAVEQRFWSRVG
jgi:hypothetical protein